MTQQRAVDESADPSAASTLRLDEQGLARALALSQPREDPPAQVAGFAIERRLGVGAYGSVWLAIERNTGKQVAIKFYNHRRGLDWSLLNREVEKLAVLYTSREVIGLLHVGWNADPPYYVMEFLQNGSLQKLLEGGPLPVHEAVRIAEALVKALVHAHQNGILHCDLKPANVLLDGAFAPRLADFGQSRLSHEQSPALGTLFYMAPEQADLNAVPDPRWDVYALGALLYHMVCGQPPFRSAENERRLSAAAPLEEKLAAYRQLVAGSPRPNQHRLARKVDARLADIIDKCLARDPAQRFGDAAAVAEALVARARHRSLRPTIALGIILPGLFMLALFPVALTAVGNAVQTSERNIAARALESDAVTAKILAYSLNDDLVQRSRTLADIADEPELLEQITGVEKPADSTERRQLALWLSKSKGEIDKARREQNADLDDSWFLNDAHGIQRWREPYSPKSIDGNFGWRDYFHGQGDDRTDWKERTDIPPLRAPHISAPFRSSTTGRLKVAISVPVWDEKKEHVLGVLGRTIHLGELLSSYKRLIQEEEREQKVRRVIALLDVRTGKVLDHPWMTEENRERLRDDNVFERLTLFDNQRRDLERLRTLVRNEADVENEHLNLKYSDPIAKIDEAAMREYGTPWLAAFWPVGDTGWFAVVEEPRDDALRPVREIQAGLVKYALVGLVLCLTLIASSWYFVRRVMRARPFRLRTTRTTS
ncbi:MAG TPA: serine/threonine protein kinase [Planctomycetaceae bacterium]|nr:serine/threonine protein kinase [Planctomycetaceae bacterium]